MRHHTKIDRIDLKLAARCLACSSAAVEAELQRRQHPLRSRYTPSDRRYSRYEPANLYRILATLLQAIDHALAQPDNEIELVFAGNKPATVNFLLGEIRLAEQTMHYVNDQPFSRREKKRLTSALKAEIKFCRHLAARLKEDIQ